MTRRTRWLVVAAAAVLLTIGLFQGGTTRRLEATTEGTAPWGYRALYDLLAELGFPVGRAYEAAAALAPGGTTWWIEPCRENGWEGQAWTEGGGTAVVFLPQISDRSCGLEALELPARAPRTGSHVVTSEILWSPRVLTEPDLLSFKRADGWIVRAWSDQFPFMLERALGQGRLLVVADGRFLRNDRLERTGALLAVDLARALGAPRFAEPPALPVERNAVIYVARSPALAVFVGLALTGALFAWAGALVPRRTSDDETIASPTLGSFVDGLAALYASTRDHRRVLGRYREMTAARLRRELRLPPETPIPTLTGRLRRGKALDPGALALLVEETPVSSEDELRAAVRRLDALVTEAATCR